MEDYLIPDLINIVNEYVRNEKHDNLMNELLSSFTYVTADDRKSFYKFKGGRSSHYRRCKTYIKLHTYKKRTKISDKILI